MKKDYYTWGKIERGCKEIADQLKKDGFVPDYIVGITRGGAIPAMPSMVEIQNCIASIPLM